MEEIKETLKKISANISKPSTNLLSESNSFGIDMIGNKNCPICGGVGYVRRELPIHDPNFGKLEICSCSRAKLQRSSLKRLYYISNLDALKNMTFENFKIEGHSGTQDPNKTLEVALNTAQNYAQHLNGWLLLMGGYGSGKTHLAAAIAHFVVSLGVPTLFLTVPDLLDWLRNTFDKNDETFEDRFYEIRNVRFLVLDDLGTQNATPWAKEKLYQIINHRYTMRLPTIITTNQEINEIDDRISSRMQDRELVTKIQINMPDYRDPVPHPQYSPIYALTNLSDFRLFENFDLRKKEKLTKDQQSSLDAAYYAAQKYADNPKGWIVFMGNFGTGKTFLAVSIGNYRAALGEKPILAVIPDLLDHLRATFNPKNPVSYDFIFNQVRDANLLILDDLGTENATRWAIEKLFQIFNYRYEANLPTVITTSLTKEEIEPKILSRLVDERICHFYEIKVPPYQLRNKKQ